MTYSLHKGLQLSLFILQIAVQTVLIDAFLPVPAHHTAVHGVAGMIISGLQWWLAVIAHRTNPDGTPAEVAYREE